MAKYPIIVSKEVVAQSELDSISNDFQKHGVKHAIVRTKNDRFVICRELLESDKKDGGFMRMIISDIQNGRVPKNIVIEF